MDLLYAATCYTDFAVPAAGNEIGARTDRMCEMVKQTITGMSFFDFLNAKCVGQTAAQYRQSHMQQAH